MGGIFLPGFCHHYKEETLREDDRKITIRSCSNWWRFIHPDLQALRPSEWRNQDCGSVTVKALPWPGRLTTVMSPP
jgi:hypothetical protein